MNLVFWAGIVATVAMFVFAGWYIQQTDEGVLGDYADFAAGSFLVSAIAGYACLLAYAVMVYS